MQSRNLLEFEKLFDHGIVEFRNLDDKIREKLMEVELFADGPVTLVQCRINIAPDRDAPIPIGRTEYGLYVLVRENPETQDVRVKGIRVPAEAREHALKAYQALTMFMHWPVPPVVEFYFDSRELIA